MGSPALRKFLIEIGKRSITYDFRAVIGQDPPRYLLVDDHYTHRIGEEWQGMFRQELSSLRLVALQCLSKQLPQEFREAYSGFMAHFLGSGMPELRRLFDHPRNNYLSELMAGIGGNAEKFKSIMKLFAELGDDYWSAACSARRTPE